MDTPVPSTAPAFLAKLWKIVEDPDIDDLICWNDSGLSFYIRNSARFSRELLPLYYKHNNMASFIRQLNMYGFHKIASMEQGGLRVERDEMEFSHKFFVRGHEYLLCNIKRKVSATQKVVAEDMEKTRPEIVTRVLSEVRNLKGKQESVDSHLVAMKRENEALWREVASLRQKHFKQQQIVNKLIQFLVTLVQRNKMPVKRRYPLAIGESSVSGAGGSKQRRRGEEGPIIHDITNELVDVVVENIQQQQEDYEESPLPSYQINSPVSADPPESVDDPVFISTEEVCTSTEQEEVYPFTVGFQIGNEPVQILPDRPITITPPPRDTPTPSEAMVAVNPTTLTQSNEPDEDSSLLDEAIMDSDLDISFSMDGSDFMQGRFSGRQKLEDMRLAVANENSSLNSRDELDSHLETFELELDGLKSLLSLQNINSFDASSLLSLFDLDDPTINPTMQVPTNSKSPESPENEGTELVSYNPTFDLGYDDHNFFGTATGDSDYLLEEDYLVDVKPSSAQLAASSPLNTPVDTPLNPPVFIRKKK